MRTKNEPTTTDDVLPPPARVVAPTTTTCLSGMLRLLPVPWYRGLPLLLPVVAAPTRETSTPRWAV